MATDPSKKLQAVQLIELIVGNPDIYLFHDEYGVAFAELKMDGHKEIWACASKQFRQWASKSFYDKFEKALSQNALASALNVIEAQAKFHSAEYRLYNRAAESLDTIWYDLADPRWRAVAIDAEGWQIIDEPPILFRRFQHHASQVEPIRGGKVQDVLRFVNVTDKDQQMLLLVYLVSCFIPGFAHPILYVYGQQGSAKSSLSKVLRKLIDPSRLEVLSLPRKLEELTQQLAHHWFLIFDNVSYIPHDTSDLLCRAVTGSGFSKRQLYTDDDDIIYSIRQNIGINGINLAAAAPDLLERSILLELKRVGVDARKDERELWKEFEEARPKILGAIFTAVAEAIRLRAGITLATLPRMADFALVGCAIAEALGYTKEEFIGAYYRNISSQNEEVLAENIEASLVIAFMFDKDAWEGPAAKLLAELQRIGKQQGIDEKHLPKSANALSRKLNTLRTNLEEIGIKFSKSKGTDRAVVLQKISASGGSENGKEAMPGLPLQDDVTDDIPAMTPDEWFEKVAGSNPKDDTDDKDDISGDSTRGLPF